MLYDNIDIRRMFPLMTFEDGDMKNFQDYLNSRGLYLYRQVYDAFNNWNGGVDEITYKQFSSLIRYDKSIRDKLYIYLAASEEYLRNIIFEELETDRSPVDTTNEMFNLNDLRVKTREEIWKDSKLYYYSYAKNFDFGLIVQIFEKFALAPKYGLIQSDITAVRVLRNKVMHHNMLLLSCFTKKSDIEKAIAEVESGIEALYRILPTQELKEGAIKERKVQGGLTQAVNKSNYPDGDISKEPYNKIICLHKFVNGGFVH
ncbi:MAG: hypothetical protein K2J01_03115 [Clostridiales bacterium]|nr:hypothetical protein [Clostridiales bacterium]